ncbi:MAG: HAD family phosphatase [Anaerolineaceae bacterium]|nr:HAD family phosphatase [Anaerolineaceae bacterium]
MTIDTVIFDFGGVLYKTPNMRNLLKWQKILGVANDPEVTKLIYDPASSELFRDVMVGIVKEEELWNLLAKQWHIPPRLYTRIQRNLMSRRRINKPLERILKSLKGKYRTAILSNAGDQTRNTMENVFGFHKLVDKIIISAEEGMAKPNKELFEITLNRLDSQAEKCVFIDDLLENIEAAKAIGMKTIHHTDNDLTILALSKHLEMGM